jgi:isopenicillin-N N-acyltransferase-like protein
MVTYEKIGLEHGRRLSTKIRSQIEVYTAMFQQTSKLSWSDVRSIASQFSHTIKTLTPDIYTEMLGIAEGAGLDVLDIVALNCRSEIALGNFSDGCTGFGWKRRDGEKAEGEVLLAQNWDWTKRVKGNCVLMSIEQAGKPKIWMVTEVGSNSRFRFEEEDRS